MNNDNRIPQTIFDPISNNVCKLAQLFPSAVKDGDVDFAALKQELGNFTEVGSEKYELTWAGKTEAKKLAQTDVLGRTLKYIPKDSKNPDTTENLYIEGDNLEVLKLLRQNYYGAIKMIYIDPPYNTGNDFVYRDNFAMNSAESDEAEGEVQDGERLVVNQKSSNRYHANWLSMMYPRLKIAKDLLKDDGVIFISIDDNEADNLKKLCNEVFGDENFVAQLIWQNKKGGGNDSTHVAIEHEYILVFAKNKNSLNDFYELYTDDYLKRYKEEDEVSKFYWDTFRRKSGKQYYPITCPDGTVLQFDDDGNPISWLRSEQRFLNDIEIGDARFVDINGAWSIQFKQRLPMGKTPRSIFTTDEVINDKGTTSTGSEDVYQYFKKDVFSNPKPVQLIKFIIGFGLQHGEIVLDFFSGSGTIAESVFECNQEDNGNRKCILVQVQEDLDKMIAKASSNQKLILDNAISILNEQGYPHYITELGKERIRRAGEKIKKEIEEANVQLKLGEEPKQVPDIGFKVFRTADTNIRWTHDELRGGQIDIDENRLSEKDRLDFMPHYTDIDVIYEVLLRQRDIPLSATIEKLPHIGERTYLFANQYAVCLEEIITADMVEQLAAIEPLPDKFILRDSAFEDNISLKDETIRRLQALIARNTGEKKRTYTVEFI